MTKKIAIIGASGYTGGELMRLLICHEGVDIVKATSRNYEGKNITDVHQNLLGFTDLKFANEPLEDMAKETDLMFFALPHSKAMGLVPKVYGKTRIIDLSADYRLKDSDDYDRSYTTHESPSLIDEFVYGLPEYNREKIRGAYNIANPGCFPTASLLALIPLAKENLLTGNVVIDAKTGSSGSGVNPSKVAHHPERACDFRAYKVLGHQHQPEILQELKRYNEGLFDQTFVTHSTPMIRGIFITAYVFPKKEISEEELKDIYEKYYEDEQFVRIVDQARCTVVKNTNFCDLSLHSDGRKLVITAAIDNLIKGASGTAIQNMNLMLEFDENTSLMYPGWYP